MGGRRPDAAGTWMVAIWAVGALLASAPAIGDELWRASIDPELCRVELVNELGGVHVEVSELPDQVAVVGDPSTLAIESSQQGGTITLRVVENGESGSGEIGIFVPASCSAAVRTDSGAATIDPGKEGLSYEVETVTGAITAIADPASDAIVELATSGEITVDFSIAIDRVYHEEPAKHGVVIIGSDSSPSIDRIHLTSRRGAISVLRRSEQPNAPS